MHTNAPRKRPEKPHIIIIDSKRLRQAGIARLLDAWAGAKGLTVSAVNLGRPIDSHIAASCAMVILSVGSASVEDPQQQALIKYTRKSMPRAPLVIFSDREEAEEVCSAFDAGAAGFMPSSLDPSVALQALSFIKCGGSFFPPSALHKEKPTVIAQSGAEATNQADVGPFKTTSTLSAKQEEVLRLLRRGQSNKIIASQLGLSEATVKVHVRCIMRKLGVANRTQVAIASMNMN